MRFLRCWCVPFLPTYVSTTERMEQEKVKFLADWRKQNCHLDRRTLSICISMIENGVNPEALAVCFLPFFLLFPMQCAVEFCWGVGLSCGEGTLLTGADRPWSRNFERKGRLMPLLLRRLWRRR